MKQPCKECPFTMTKEQFSDKRLKEFAKGEFPCHKTADLDDEGDYKASGESVHCAGALIYLEKRKAPHQMMRICERLGMYNYKELKMDSNVR